VISNIKKFTARSSVGARKGLRTWGEATMSKIKRDDVPRKFGTLAASGTVDSVDEASDPGIELSFGGSHPASGYAIPVHEVPATHKHGSDKYLERPALSEAKAHLNKDVGDAVKRETGMK
jgi:hypothetical protein